MIEVFIFIFVFIYFSNIEEFNLHTHLTHLYPLPAELSLTGGAHVMLEALLAIMNIDLTIISVEDNEIFIF